MNTPIPSRRGADGATLAIGVRWVRHRLHASRWEAENVWAEGAWLTTCTACRSCHGILRFDGWVNAQRAAMACDFCCHELSWADQGSALDLATCILDRQSLRCRCLDQHLRLQILVQGNDPCALLEELANGLQKLYLLIVALLRALEGVVDLQILLGLCSNASCHVRTAVHLQPSSPCSGKQQRCGDALDKLHWCLLRCGARTVMP